MHLFDAFAIISLLFFPFSSIAAPTKTELAQLHNNEVFNTTNIASAQWGHCVPGELYCYNEIVYDMSTSYILVPFTFLRPLRFNIPSNPTTAEIRLDYPATELDRQYCRDEWGAGCYRCEVGDCECTYTCRHAYFMCKNDNDWYELAGKCIRRDGPSGVGVGVLGGCVINGRRSVRRGRWNDEDR